MGLVPEKWVVIPKWFDQGSLTVESWQGHEVPRSSTWVVSGSCFLTIIQQLLAVYKPTGTCRSPINFLRSPIYRRVSQLEISIEKGGVPDPAEVIYRSWNIWWSPVVASWKWTRQRSREHRRGLACILIISGDFELKKQAFKGCNRSIPSSCNEGNELGYTLW